MKYFNFHLIHERLQRPLCLATCREKFQTFDCSSLSTQLFGEPRSVSLSFSFSLSHTHTHTPHHYLNQSILPEPQPTWLLVALPQGSWPEVYGRSWAKWLRICTRIIGDEQPWQPRLPQHSHYTWDERGNAPDLAAFYMGLTGQSVDTEEHQPDEDWASHLLLLFSHSVVSDSLQPHGLQHARLPCPSPTPRACSNSNPSSQWCHPTISSSVVSFFSCPQSFLASRSFLMCWLFASGGQSIGASASAPVLPMNIQDWFPLGWTDWISLHSKGLSRVFSNTSSKASIFQHSAFFIVQLSHPYITPGKPIALTIWTFVSKIMSAF